MAIVMLMDWPDTTPEEYGAVMTALRLDETAPAGGIFHVAGFEGGTLRILDVWESDDAWSSFLQDRLIPAIAETGKEGQPNVRTYPVHNLFVPDLAALESLGAPSPAAA